MEILHPKKSCFLWDSVCVCACAFVRTCNYAILADSLKRLQTLYWVSLTLVALQDSGLKLLEREVVGNY